jgi:hypothetical protein
MDPKARVAIATAGFVAALGGVVAQRWLTRAPSMPRSDPELRPFSPDAAGVLLRRVAEVDAMSGVARAVRRRRVASPHVPREERAQRGIIALSAKQTSA